MRKISVDNIEIGMKVAKPVANSKGIVLLPHGAEFNEITIARLKKWKIEECFVEGEAVSEIHELKLKMGEVPEDESMQEIDKKIDHMFSDVIDDEIMQGMAMVSKSYLKEKKVNEKQEEE